MLVPVRGTVLVRGVTAMQPYGQNQPPFMGFLVKLLLPLQEAEIFSFSSRPQGGAVGSALAVTLANVGHAFSKNWQ